MTSPQQTPASDPTNELLPLVLESVALTKRALERVVSWRAMLTGLGAGLAVATIAMLASPLLPLGWPAVVVLSVVTAALVAYATLVRSSRVTPLRTALWMEEQRPAGFSLVTLVEMASRAQGATLDASPSVQHTLATAYVNATGGPARVDETIRHAVASHARERMRSPLWFVLGAAAVLTWILVAPRVGRSARGVVGSGATSDRLADGARPVGAWRVRVEPPAYSRLPARTIGDVESLQALSGSRVVIDGVGERAPSAVARALSDSTMTIRGGGVAAPVVTLRDGGWQLTSTVPPLPMEVRVTRGTSTRLLLVDGIIDSIPRVLLRLPARDSVLRSGAGTLSLDAVLHDDIGLASGAFELIVSSGEGERFTARTELAGARRYAGEHEATLHATLNLDALKLGPGDLIHMRAVARDANPTVGREAGTSETRSFRIARPTEYDSISVEPAPPPEVDKSLMSERMLLMLTEKLLARRAALSTTVFGDESRNLAREQSRLRLAVGDAVFQRLGSEASAEDSHDANSTDPRGVTMVNGKLTLPGSAGAGGVNESGMLEEGEDSPVIGINKPLLEAYNAMWDAGRALELADVKGAIPHMRVALAAIERARAASRLYLRGKPPAVILDITKIRLAGKDTGITNVRGERAPLSPRARLREGRLLVAASIASHDATAARDSIAVLRLEAVAEMPDFAAALGGILDAMRRGGDVTDSFVRARRVLGGVQRAPNSAWSRTDVR